MAVVDWDGRPERPDVDGWHWVDDRPRAWMAEYQMWAMSGFQDDTPPEIMVLNGHRYSGPCYTAADIAAAVQAERAECADAASRALNDIALSSVARRAILARGPTSALAVAIKAARAEGMEAAAVWHEEQAAINATAGSPTSSANHRRYAAAIRAQIKQGDGAK